MSDRACRVSDLVSRRDRCECAPTQADVKRCFWLSFDQQAFIAAAVKTDEQLREMFNERLVWRDPHVIAQLRMRGLVQRIYAPQVRRHMRLRTALAPSAATGTLLVEAVRPLGGAVLRSWHTTLMLCKLREPVYTQHDL